MFLVPSGTQRSHVRLRVVPFVKYGRENGLEVSYKEVPQGFLARYSFFSQLPHVDMFVVHRELFSSYELANLRRLCKTLAYDFSDGVWTQPERERTFGGGILEAKRARRFERICREADICIVDNQHLADKVAGYQDDIRIIPTPVDTAFYAPGDGGKVGGTTLVGWMGTPGDEAYLDVPMLHLESHCGSIQFSIVSDEPYSGPGSEYVFWASWSEKDEARMLQAMDVGLTPLADDEFLHANSGVDVLKYMASGVAVVASDIGANSDIIDHGIDGFLVRNDEDWARYVMRLAEDAELRRNMIEAARRKAVEKYDMRLVAYQFWRALGVQV